MVAYKAPEKSRPTVFLELGYTLISFKHHVAYKSIKDSYNNLETRAITTAAYFLHFLLEHQHKHTKSQITLAHILATANTT